jgi:nucleoside-diphosphate-sugar epimerase
MTSTGRIANLSDARLRQGLHLLQYGRARRGADLAVRAAHRPEIVFHLAAQAGVRPRWTIRAGRGINMGSLNVIECAAKVGARR